MKILIRFNRFLCAAMATAWCLTAQSQDVPGADVESLLSIARYGNPEYAGSRQEAVAAYERVQPAGALPDPKLLVELMDITHGGQQNPTLNPGLVGSARYTIMQDVPWFGKRDLRREIAELDADSAKKSAQVTWNDVATRIKATYAQRYYLLRNKILTEEILDLMRRLEKIAQARYARDLAAQQDVIRAQVEQTRMRTELITLENERKKMDTRLNALLARPANAPLSTPQRLRPLPPPTQLSYAVLEQQVRAHNPQLSIEESRLESAEKNRELTYKNRYPDFFFGVAPNQFQNSVQQWNVLVGLNIPLQQETRRSQERESEAMVLVARSRRQATTNQVLADLAENISGLDAARKTEALATNTLLPQSELTFKSALAGYENGRVDFATLLDAQRQIRIAKQDQIRAQAEGQIRLAEIERILGEFL